MVDTIPALCYVFWDCAPKTVTKGICHVSQPCVPALCYDSRSSPPWSSPPWSSPPWSSVSTCPPQTRGRIDSAGLWFREHRRPILDPLQIPHPSKLLRTGVGLWTVRTRWARSRWAGLRWAGSRWAGLRWAGSRWAGSRWAPRWAPSLIKVGWQLDQGGLTRWADSNQGGLDW